MIFVYPSGKILGAQAVGRRNGVNNAAMVGLNILNGELKKVPVTKARELVENKELIIDLRSPEAYEKGHIKGAINIPLDQFRDRLSEIPKDQPVYWYCRSGQFSYNMARALVNLGYENVVNIEGSFLVLSAYEYFNDLTVERESILTGDNFN